MSAGTGRRYPLTMVCEVWRVAGAGCFVALDHCVSDVVGWHVAKRGDRWAALEPVRQGVRAHMVGYAPKIALGLGLRHDWGPQYTAHQFEGELQWLGIRSRAAYVGEPECNGVVELTKYPVSD